MSKIPEGFLNLIASCPDCDWKATPDLIFGHLLEMHEYTVEQADRNLNAWIESFQTDEDGNPLGECLFHGLYQIQEGCGGCAQEDQQMEIWKESRYRGK